MGVGGGGLGQGRGPEAGLGERDKVRERESERDAEAGPPTCRRGQPGAAGALHHRDADEDVRAGAAPVLHVHLQPLRLLRGVQRRAGAPARGVGRHEPAGHLRAALHPPP